MKKVVLPILFFFMVVCPSIFAVVDPHYLTVAQDGSGDFKTINAAIAALPMFNYERTVIYIKNGVYNEKFRIDQDYVTLRGESRDKTIIRYSLLRTDWIANKDSIGAAVVNLNGDDIVIENMTIENSQPEIGPHAFAIYGTGTRTIIINCNVLSKGGDTVSLWDYKTGMYYHANCYFEGAVDFVCPRGWCFIRDSKFYEVKQTASIWHAGGFDSSQKFVLKNCSFDGIKGFELGRHHYEAQFYLLDCTFSDNMKDKPIYRVVNADPKQNRPFNWGERYYYYRPQKTGTPFSWLKDNMNSLGNAIKESDITPAWTFDGKWDPESNSGPQVKHYTIGKNKILIEFDEIVTVIGTPEVVSSSGKKLIYASGAGSNVVEFKTDASISEKDIQNLKVNNTGKMIGTKASVSERAASLKL